MNNATSQMVGDSFRVGFRFQRHWDNWMAYAFFCGEVGAGTFFVSMLFNSVAGMLLGLLITGCGKTWFHISHMGVPKKSWRAILRPDRSWVSRGLVGIVFFIGAGSIHMLNVAFGHPLPGVLGIPVALVAGAAALLVSTYQGLAMSHSTAIALWSSAVLPVSSILYAMTCGTALCLLFDGHSLGLAAMAQLHNVLMLLLFLDAMVLLSLLHGAWNGSPGARMSAELLSKTIYARFFHGLVVGAGIMLPLLLLWTGGFSFVARLFAAIGILSGFLTFRVLMFKAGVYDPILSFKPRVKA